MRFSRRHGLMTPKWPFSGSGRYGFVPATLTQQEQAEAGPEGGAEPLFQSAILVRQQARVTAARPKLQARVPSSAGTSSEGSGAPATAPGMTPPGAGTPGADTGAGEAETAPGEATGEPGTADVQTLTDGAGSGLEMANQDLPAGEYVGGTELGPEAGVGVEEEGGSKWPIYLGVGLGVAAVGGVLIAILAGGKRR